MFFDLGKNYTCETFPSTSLDLSLIVQLFPGLKFMTCYVYGMSYYFSSPLPKGMKANFVKYDGSRFLYQYFGNDQTNSHFVLDCNDKYDGDDIVQHIMSIADDIPRHYHHVEILVFILLMHGKYSEAIQFIEKYNTLNQDYFSYLWNIIMNHEVFHRTHTNIAELIHFVLQLKKRFKRISITKFEINTISDFEIVEKFNFTEQIRVMKCLTYQFLKEVTNNNNKSLLTSMIDKYGVPYGYFGLSLLHCNSQWMIEFIQNQIPDYDFNSTARCELGVPFTMQIVPLLKICVNYETIALDPFQLDIDGNNLLHYLCLCYTHGIRSLIPTVSDQNFTELMKQKNKFGLTPSVVSALSHGVTNRDPAELSCEITMEVVKRANLQCRNGSYGVVHDEHYTDIDYRDENGKHPCHYITKYYHLLPENRIPSSIYLPIIMCKDKNGQIPLQNLDANFSTLIRFLKSKKCLVEDFVSHFDNFGWNRFMHYYVFGEQKNQNMMRENILQECLAIAFDYSCIENPKLVSLQTIYRPEQKELEFRMNQVPFPKMYGRVGVPFVEGDDISHLVIRVLIERMSSSSNNNHHCMYDVCIVSHLIRRGLRLDRKNSEGKTAFDLFQEFAQSIHSVVDASLVKLLRKGCSKSKAKLKYRIELTSSRHVQICEQSDRHILCRAPDINQNEITGTIKVTRYF